MQTENDLLPPSFCEPLENAPPTPSLEPAAVAPVAAQERIITLDVLRGAVLLGILLMNILSFSLPGRAQWDDKWNDLKPSGTVLAKEMEAKRGSYWKLFQWRWPKVSEGHGKGL